MRVFDLETGSIPAPRILKACPNRFSGSNSYTQLGRRRICTELACGGLPQRPRNSSALLQIRHLPAIWQDDFHKAQEVSSVAGSMATGSDHVADLDRVLVPAAVPAEHGWTPGFAGPLFDLAPIVLHIQVNLHVGIDESEVRHSSFDRHDFRRVVVRLSVMCQHRARNQKNAEN